jgi:hypothetical protein
MLLATNPQIVASHMVKTFAPGYTRRAPAPKSLANLLTYCGLKLEKACLSIGIRRSSAMCRLLEKRFTISLSINNMIGHSLSGGMNVTLRPSKKRRLVDFGGLSDGAEHRVPSRKP